MEGRTQDVVAPASEKITSVDDYRAGLWRRILSGSESSCRFAGKEGAYDHRCRDELLRSGALDLESPDLKGNVSVCVRRSNQRVTHRVLEKQSQST